MVLPKAIREIAHIEVGDELEFGYTGGLIVLRKPEPLDSARVRHLLKEGRKLPEMTAEDEATVEAAIGRIRRRASKQ